MMLILDEQLLKKTKGKTDEALELAIQELHGGKVKSSFFGHIIPLQSLLLNREKVFRTIMSTISNYWGEVDLLLTQALQDTNIDLENANKRLYSFIKSRQGQRAIFNYLLVHNSLRFDNLIYLIFGKEVTISATIGGLRGIYLYKIGEKFFVHALYNQRAKFWSFLFAKKIYSLFMQAPLNSIQSSFELIKRLKAYLEAHYTPNHAVVLLNKLVDKLDFQNPRSFELKGIHLFNIITHFNGGKRHHRKINKLISAMFSDWGTGTWALTEKENTLLIYILAIDAANQQDIEKTILYGKYLLGEDRLINHAIELLLEFSDILPDIKPAPDTLVKRYDQNYLEQLFYVYINALVQNGQYTDVVPLIKEHVIASCTSIYNHLNSDEHHEDLLYRIQTTIQYDIALIVDNSPQHVVKSIESWLQHYQVPDSPYYYIAIQTSKHLCNLLKVFFVTKQFDLFEHLMEIYKKYLKIDEHFLDLKDFVAEYVNS